jgi:hypothetical protein
MCSLGAVELADRGPRCTPGRIDLDLNTIGGYRRKDRGGQRCEQSADNENHDEQPDVQHTVTASEPARPHRPRGSPTYRPGESPLGE